MDLDPVDGTINLMHDYQHNVVSLTLCLVPQGGWSVPGRPQNWPRLCCFGAGIYRLRQAKGLFLNPWDYAAGMLLIQEAGGKVNDFAVKPLDPRKGGRK